MVLTCTVPSKKTNFRSSHTQRKVTLHSAGKASEAAVGDLASAIIPTFSHGQCSGSELRCGYSSGSQPSLCCGLLIVSSCCSDPPPTVRLSSSLHNCKFCYCYGLNYKYLCCLMVLDNSCKRAGSSGPH